MSMLEDPEMVEVVQDFCKESGAIYTRLEDILNDYEEAPSNDKLEEFGQVIDRVMGAAKSIEASRTGMYCELGKTISYKASQTHDDALLDIVIAVLFDTVEILQIMNRNIVDSKKEEVPGFNLEAFGTRLRWLADKFKNITRSSVAIDEETQKVNPEQKTIDQLLDQLGL